MIAQDKLQLGDRVRCKLNGYQGLEGTLDELETDYAGVACGWVRWDDMDKEIARTGCFFALWDLARARG